MICERIYLYDDNDKVYLDTYIPRTESGVRRKVMLVLPGGGYCQCWWGEGEPVARQFMTSNYCTFVLNYSAIHNIFRPSGVPAPLIDASKAVAYIKRNADKYLIDPDRIAVVGFSAGGHLAATLGTMWHCDFVEKEAEIAHGENRVAAMILGYPVISSDPRIAHTGSFKTLLTDGKGEPNEKDLEFYSAEKQVSDKTVPAFIWHTATDNGVSVQNSLVMAEALSKNKIPFELHIFPEGPHGRSIATRDIFPDDGDYLEHIAEWVELAKKWLDTVM